MRGVPIDIGMASMVQLGELSPELTNHHEIVDHDPRACYLSLEKAEVLDTPVVPISYSPQGIGRTRPSR